MNGSAQDVARARPLLRMQAIRNVDWFRLGAVLIALGILVVVIAWPLYNILVLSLLERGTSMSLENLTTANFRRLAESSLFRGAIFSSVQLTLWVVFFSTVVGVAYAYMLARVRLPLNHALMMTLGTIPLLLPPFVGAYSWVMLFGRSGTITQLLDSAIGFSMPPIYGMTGMVLALSATMWPFVFLLSYGAFALGDPSLEESADVMGASPLRKLMTVTVPLVTPAVLTGSLVVFMRTIGEFGTPAILGGNTYVIPTLIYFRITGHGDFHMASTMALVSVAFSVVCLAILALYLKRRDYTTVTSRAQSAKKVESPLVGWFAAGLCLLIVFISLLPHLTVLLGAFATHWRGTTLPTEFGFDNFIRVFERDQLAIRNSIVLTLGATGIATVVGTMLAYVATRKRTHGKLVIDATVMLPFILPGIVVGVAMAAAFSSGHIVLTGTGLILVLAYFVRRMPYNFRSGTSSLHSLDDSMEEASTVCGASWAQTSRKVTIPLIMPGVLAGAVLTFISLIGELSSTIILFSGGWKTISVAIYEYVISNEIGSAFALGSLLICLVFIAVFFVYKFLGVAMATLFSGK
jgi:iron(III) transport system permease protein